LVAFLIASVAIQIGFENPALLVQVADWLLNPSVLVPAASGCVTLLCMGAIWTCTAWRRRVIGPLREVTSLIGQEPQSADWYWCRSFLFEDLGLHDSCLADLTRAIEIDPCDPCFYRSRAHAYRAIRDHRKALDDRTRAIELLAETGQLAADDWHLFADRALDYVELGDDARAIADLTEALALIEDDADADNSDVAWLLYQRSEAFRRQGNRAGAEKDLKESRRRDPSRLCERGKPRTLRVVVFFLIVLALILCLTLAT
jgi:tetratricopeptide (TPR) repeat protein